MTVSVVIPVYNAISTLKESVQSILNQTYSNFELIAIDDCSSDGSFEQLMTMSKQDQRVKVFRNEKNLGVVKTLNRAVSLAKGEFIARMDADDESLPNRFKLQVSVLQSKPRTALVGGPYQFMGRFKALDLFQALPTSAEQIRAEILSKNPICHPTVMFRRSVFDSLGGYREDFVNAEDYDLWLRMSREHDLENLSVPVLRYRLSPGGVTLSRRWEMHVYHHLAIQSHLKPNVDLNELKKTITNGRDSRTKTAFLKWIYSDLASKQLRLGYPGRWLMLYFRLMQEVGLKSFFTKEHENNEDFARG